MNKNVTTHNFISRFLDKEKINITTVHNQLLSYKGKIIHQIWFTFSIKSKKLYQDLKKYRNSWDILNPDWFHYIWTEKIALFFMKLYYPSYVSLYNSYPYAIQRVDVLRYFILQMYGGIYVDMDMECLKSLTYMRNLFPKDIYIIETANSTLGSKVSNSMMFSIPKHPFWKKVIKKLRKNKDTPWYYSRHLSIMYSTGPSFLNRLFTKYQYKLSLNLFPMDLFNPKGISDDVKIIDRNKVYTIHHGAGSWENGDSKIMVILYCNYKIIILIILILIIPFFLLKKGKSKPALNIDLKNTN